MPAIRVRDLRKSYGAIEAVRGVGFDLCTTGLGFNARDLWSLLAWTVAGSVLAVRLFRWDPVKK
jgi:hypothetical protein